MKNRITGRSFGVLSATVVLAACLLAMDVTAKEVRPATIKDFTGVWIGYNGAGDFLRITLNEDKSGSCVLIHPYDETMESYRVTIQDIVPRKWGLRLRFTPVSGQFAEAFEATGNWDWYRLKMTVKGGQGKGWEMGLEVLREKDLSRYVQMAKEYNPRLEGTASEKPQAEPAKAMYHVVEKGQDLYTIAEMYGVTVEALTKANDITNWIRIGQKLKLPVGAEL
jgi:hypothetical protein